MQEDPERENPAELGGKPEALVEELDTLPGRLGFIESEVLHTEVVQAIASGGTIRVQDVWTRYLDSASDQLDTIRDDKLVYLGAQIGLIVAMAVIWREAGDEENKFYELLNAYDALANFEAGEKIETAEKRVIAPIINAAIDSEGRESPELVRAIDRFYAERQGGATASMKNPDPGQDGLTEESS